MVLSNRLTGIYIVKERLNRVGFRSLGVMDVQFVITRKLRSDVHLLAVVRVRPRLVRLLLSLDLLGLLVLLRVFLHAILGKLILLG